MIVLDASVVIKWLVDESGSDAARAYRNDHVVGTAPVAVPELLFYEIANVLALKSRLSPDETRLAFGAIADMELESYHLGTGDYVKAMNLSQRLGISAYDAAYVALAEKLGASLVTDDRKLFRRCEELGFVQLLG